MYIIPLALALHNNSKFKNCGSQWQPEETGLVPRPSLAAADGLHHRTATREQGLVNNLPKVVDFKRTEHP